MKTTTETRRFTITANGIDMGSYDGITEFDAMTAHLRDLGYDATVEGDEIVSDAPCDISSMKATEEV